MQKATDYKKYNQEYFKRVFHNIHLDRKTGQFHYRSLAAFASEGLHRNSYILDVGCGSGALCFCLSEYYDHVIGIDVSTFGSSEAKSIYSSKKIHYITANGESIPFKSETFDCVVVSHIFEHLADEEAARMQKEIYRVLKVGGMLVVEQPFFGKMGILDAILVLLFASWKNKKYCYYSLMDIRRAKKKTAGVDFHHLEKVGEPTHRRVYDAKLLVNELSKAGFGKFKFFRRRIFSILFFNRNDIFERYVEFFIKAPEIIRRIFLVNIGGRVKTIKTGRLHI